MLKTDESVNLNSFQNEAYKNSTDKFGVTSSWNCSLFLRTETPATSTLPRPKAGVGSLEQGILPSYGEGHNPYCSVGWSLSSSASGFL